MYRLIFIFLLFPLFAAAQDSLPVPRSQILMLHNRYRQVLRQPKIFWSDTLAQTAQAWADKIAETGQIHKSETLYGENIYWSDKNVDWSVVIDSWAEEQKYYYGGTVTADGLLKYQHYTQIIWLDTRAVGCGRSKTKGGLYIYVCHYFPKGNIIGQKPY